MQIDFLKQVYKTSRFIRVKVPMCLCKQVLVKPYPSAKTTRTVKYSGCIESGLHIVQRASYDQTKTSEHNWSLDLTCSGI